MRNRQFIELVRYKVASNLKAEINRYALSYLWWVIEPALHLLILYIVFGIFFKGNSHERFIPFLFCGLAPWFWFNKSISDGMESILKGRQIIRDTYIPKYFFSTVSIIMNLFKGLILWVILIVVLVISGFYPSKLWLYLPLIILLELLLIASIVYFVSIIVPYFLDLKYIINTALQILMFSAGIFYDYKTMPEVYHKIFLINPVALLINMYRDVLMYQKPINLGNYLYILLFVCVFGVLSYVVHKKLDKEIPKVLFR